MYYKGTARHDERQAKQGNGFSYFIVVDRFRRCKETEKESSTRGEREKAKYWYGRGRRK